MKNSIKILALIAISCFINGQLFSQVTSDYDKTVDFTKYHTYTFAGWQEGSDKVLNDLDKGRLLNSLKSEFSARNMNLVESDGDAIISLYLVIDQKTSTTAYTNYNGGYGAARWGWGMGSSTTTYSEEDYLEGTLVVDVYDGASKKLIWQGVSRSTVVEKASKREKTIPKKVAKLMKKYPVTPQK